MKATRTHRFNLGGVGLNREELHLLAGDVRQVVQETGPHLTIDRWIFNRCIGKYEGGRVGLLFGLFWDVGNKVAITILVS